MRPIPLSSLWRTILLLLVIAVILFWQFSMNPPSQPKPNPAVSYKRAGSSLCIVSGPLCGNLSTDQPNHGSGDIELVGYHKQTAVQVKTTVSSVKPVKAMCHSITPASVAYTQALASALSRTNLQADTTRQSAAQNGEPYETFDSQENSIFATYNSEAQQSYTVYRKALDGCPATISAPILFQMFSP